MHEITFAAEFGCLREVREFIDAAAANAGFPEEERFQIKVAVSESVSNAIEHGSPRGAADRITVACGSEDGEFVVSVTDRGRFRLPVGAAGDPLERGRGLAFMSHLMDSIEITPAEDGTSVRLVRRLPAARR